MGAAESTLSKAEEEGVRRADQVMQEGYEEEKRKDQERKLKKRKLAEQTASTQAPTVSPDLEPGEVTESSVDSAAVPIRSGNSSQSTSGANDILASFNPRKEREQKKQPADANGKQTVEESVGVRNESSSSKANTRQPAKVRSMLDTTADSIKVSRTPPSALSSKSAGAPKAPTISAKVSAASKRPAAEDASTEGRRISASALSSMPKIQKRTSVASPQSPDRAEDGQAPSDGERHPPRWYKETQVLSRNKKDSGIDILLDSLRTEMSKPKKLNATQHKQELRKVYSDVRHKLHTIIFQEVNPQVLKRNRMLHNHDGLPQIFDKRYSNGVAWPFDIQADAKEVYTKWCRKDFGTDIMRGIKFSISVKGTKKDSGDSIDREYQDKVVSAKKRGNNGLVNGQWWPFQICALRDGAHGVVQGGIFGSSGDGAYSCIMSGGVDSQNKPYPDQDEGEVVFYCGTDSDNGEPTAYTQRMLESVNGEPVRLIRSHNAHTKYAPEVGFRYDGLYNVTDVERMDPEKSIRQRHRFKLVRVAGQDPIRGGDDNSKRPTAQEIEQYNTHQSLSGKKG